MKYGPGHRFVKAENAGFVGESLQTCMIDTAAMNSDHLGRLDPPPCMICDDPECVEWANSVELDSDGKVVAYLYHVSECEMLPVGD